ncbi:SGNH/GDSL hydrolase family protein [Niallia taxi]|nr:SGNH/GDSL hydrolase family protein [Niallia taxi]MDE5054907.1 SGNH/GDSL hydrolase family protein [Niallia taxi]
MAMIRDILNKIRTARYGKEVRSAIADGLEAVNKESESTVDLVTEIEGKQTSLEQQFIAVQQNATDIDPSSTELVAAHVNTNTGVTFQTIGQRLDEENEDVNNKINQSGLPFYGIEKTLHRLLRKEKTTILCAGTSITANSSPGDSSQKWVELFKVGVRNQFPNTDIIVQNSGVGSSTSSHLKANWDTLVTPYAPNLIVIDHGTNDINVPNAERVENYKFFVEKAKELGADLLFVTNAAIRFDPAPYGNSFTDDTARRDELAQQTRDFARKYRVGLVDANAAFKRFLQNKGLGQSTTLLNYDHLHPNDIGHQIIAYVALLPFKGGLPETWMLHENIGGENYGLYGNKTLWDVEQSEKMRYGWASFGLLEQQVSYAGLWWNRDSIGRPFQKAKLYGTQVTTGNEPTKGNYQPNWHIIPKDNDYISLKVKDPKRVWVGLTGSSSESTEFKVFVNDVLTLTLQISSATKGTIEIPFNAAGLKYFRKGKHTIRIERTSLIPSTAYVEFHGFLVEFYDKREPEIFGEPANKRQVVRVSSYETLEETIYNRQDASNIGIIAPNGYSEGDYGFLQAATRKPAVLYQDFYGDVLKLRFKNLLVDNFIFVYIDGKLVEEVNTKSTVNGSLNVKEYTSLGTGKVHRWEAISMNGEINLQGVRYSDTVAG